MQTAEFTLNYFSDVREMKSAMINSFFFMLMLGFSSHQKALGAEYVNTNLDTIYWESGKLLERSDFRGSEPSASRFAAFAYTIILMEYEVKTNNRNQIVPIFNIRSAFNPNSSWISKSTLDKPDRILMHEQLHFDIAEITARRLRKALEKATYTRNFKREINEIYKLETDLGDKMQKEYDKETDHGLNAKKQQLWSDKVEKILVETDNFK